MTTTSNLECSHGTQCRVDPKRTVNLTINEVMVTEAQAYTNNLSATMAPLLAEFVVRG
ncbi:MAG: type II toxin-antitoxin system CcdA family antitoxin [Burkholderiales bacterium]|nr:type II toxin-antitoxin system CcdA family antitoxin [Burkholderiales bacterium]